MWLVYWMNRVGAFQPRVVPYRDTRERGLFRDALPVPAESDRHVGGPAGRSRRQRLLHVVDVDILDDTPLLDIKPYVPEFDAHPSSKAGWFDARGVDRQVADGRFHGNTGSPRGERR